jgi:titin
VKATAPQNFTAIDSGSFVATTWTAPTDLGGSAVSYYQVQTSRDNGSTWSVLVNANGNLTGFNVTRPTKGQSWIYRVVAVTGFGASDASNAVTIAAALTVPGAPAIRSLVFATDGSMNLAWALPSDNGGTALTAVIVEKSLDNIAWTALAPLAANASTANFARELPGVRVYYRVKSVNAVGSSAYSPVTSLLTPYVKASAPQNVTAVDNGSLVVLNWVAPANLGGSSVSQYAIFISRDGGNVWTLNNYAGSTATSINVARPAKGQTLQYRVIARTAFGDSDVSTAAAISVGTTVTSTPGLRSVVVNPDGTITLAWAAPTDLGGVALGGYIVERSADNLNWTALSATTLSINIPGGGPGARTYLRVKASNSVGVSAASSVATVLVPYVKATAPQNLTAAFAGGRVVLNWQAPANTGGSAVSQYAVEYSANSGATWVLTAYSSSLTATVNAAAKGQAFSYRISARTLAGTGEYSAVVSAATPSTVASAVRLNSAIATGAGTFNLTFSAPSDLGGYAGYNYRVEALVNNVWTPVASGTGAAVNVIALTTANRTSYFSYRVIATNPTGESVAAAFSYRG